MCTNDLPNYVQVLLAQIVQQNGFINYSMEVRPGSRPGDGYNSKVLSVRIVEKTSERKLDIVCKTCNNANSYIFFNREVLFYNNLMPTLDDFQKEKQLSENDQFLSHPRCYASVADDIRKQYAIVMEDVRSSGFEMWDKTLITPITHLRLIMKELGKFHGLSIAMKDQKPHQFAQLKLNTDPFVTISEQYMHEIFYVYFDAAIKSLRIQDHKNMIHDIKQNYGQYVKHCITSRTTDHFLVLSHGDIWNNNLLYRYNQESFVEKTQFLDWQQSRYGSLTLDLLQILFSSTDRALRDKELQNLLEIYYNSLTKTVELLGTNLNEMFTLEELKDEMKRCGNFVLIMAPILIPGSSAHQLNDAHHTLDDNIHAKNHPDGFHFDDHVLSEYDRRLNEVVEDVVKLGYYRRINFEI